LAILAVAVFGVGVLAVQGASGHADARKAVKKYRLEGGPIQFQTGGLVTIVLNVRKKHGKTKPTRVDAMSVDDVDMSCDEGQLQDVGFSAPESFRVKKDGSFIYNFEGIAANFTGQISKKGKLAEGGIVYQGVDTSDGMGNDYTNCTLPGNPNYTAVFEGIED
jgi:hypothetical protein